jgi:hypothetical protein
MVDLVINTSITHSLLLVLPVAVALLLRWARCPGWPLIGGVIAGILLGPSIFGRIAPDAFEKCFVGGIEERDTRDALARRQAAERLVAFETGRDATAVEAMETRHALALAEADAALVQERWRFQRPLRSYAAAIIVLALLGAGVCRAASGTARTGWIAPGSIGIWAAAMPGGLAFAAMVWLWRASFAEAALAAAAVAIGPWVLTAVDREAADRAEDGGARLVERAGHVSSLAAIAVTCVACFAVRGAGALIWCAPLLAMPIGWLLSPGATGRIGRIILDSAVLPALGACVGLRVDLHTHFALWPFIVFIILSGDGRWLGAFIGAMLPGARAPLRTLRLVVGSMACGPTQLAIAATLAGLGVVRPEVVLALLAGAVLIEITTPARRSVTMRLEEQEEGIE